MNGWRGLLGGALALIILEVILTSPQATGRVGGFFSGLADGVSWFVSESTPAIPDRAATAAATTSSAPTTTLASAVLVPTATTKAPAYSSINTKGATP